jgi:hypothetical protein
MQRDLVQNEAALGFDRRLAGFGLVSGLCIGFKATKQSIHLEKEFLELRLDCADRDLVTFVQSAKEEASSGSLHDRVRSPWSLYRLNHGS